MPVLCELCLPFVKTGGVFCALKGKSGIEELFQSEKAIETLGGKLISDEHFSLCEISGGEKLLADRHLILIEKTAATPENYPRRFAQITKSPL